jgi:hypothetical protein
MSKQNRQTDAGKQKQQPMEEAKKQADQSGPRGEQGNQIAEKTNMKRQEKQMHDRTGK